VLGVIQDVTKRTKMALAGGSDLYLIGATDSEFSGSEWAHVNGKQIGDRAPKADLAREWRLVELLLAGQELFTSAHDLADGGLATGLVEMALRGGIGADVDLTSVHDDLGAALFAETPGRVIVAIDPADADQLVALAQAKQIPLTKLGHSGAEALVINGAEISLSELRAANSGIFEALFN
jgi:phosphoribosylformylglycinamidine synthase